jgi:hypothetical protein
LIVHDRPRRYAARVRPFALLSLVIPLAACPPDKDDTATGTAVTDQGTGPLTGDPPQTTGTTGDATTGTTGAPVDDCAFLVGRSFASDMMLECGLGPNGPELCNWTLSFTMTGYDHQYSDIGESGDYTCRGGAITGTAGDVQHAGTVDADTGKLIWDDVAYTVVP